jgi:hypothetical protein
VKRYWASSSGFWTTGFVGAFFIKRFYVSALSRTVAAFLLAEKFDELLGARRILDDADTLPCFMTNAPHKPSPNTEGLA